MKTLSLFLALFLLAAPVFAAEPPTPDVTIKVNGMVCDFCAQSIKKVFGKDEAVENVDVNLDDSVILVDFKDGAVMEDEAMKQLVIDSGYDVEEIIHAE